MLKRFTSVIFRIQPIYQFNSSKQHQYHLKRELLQNYQQYQPWKTIRIMHELTMVKYDPEITSAIKTVDIRQDDTKIHKIIGQLSGQIHKIPHRQINILLEILKQRGYRYDKDAPIFRALNKICRMCFGKQFKQHYLPISIFYLKALGFPKQTITKIFQEYASVLKQMENSAKKNNIQIPLLLKMGILCLEQRYVPLPVVQKIINFIVKQNITTLISLCSLYHMSIIISQCLEQKVESQVAKVSARQILFTSYHQLQQQQDKNQDKVSEVEKYSEEHQMQVKRQLVQISQSILKTFTNEVDIKKLEQSIVKSVESDIEPFTKEQVLYVCNIDTLKPYILKFIDDNLQRLTPVELSFLAKHFKENSLQIIEKYMSKMKAVMNVQDQCYLYSQLSRHYRKQIKAELIFRILSQLEDIKYEQFVAIARLTEQLPKSEQHYIEEIIRIIKQKTSQDEFQSQKKGDKSEK